VQFARSKFLRKVAYLLVAKAAPKPMLTAKSSDEPANTAGKSIGSRTL